LSLCACAAGMGIAAIEAAAARKAIFFAIRVTSVVLPVMSRLLTLRWNGPRMDLRGLTVAEPRRINSFAAACQCVGQTYRKPRFFKLK
jgi:hypothetical protein